MDQLISTPVEIENILNPDGKCIDPAVFVQTENTNKEIDEQAGEPVFDALKPSPDVDTTSFTDHVTSNDFKLLAKQYGNNLFELEVEQTHLFGVLKELPTLSLTSHWKPNTTSSVINSLKNMSSNTKVQMINSIFGVPQLPWVAGGDATTQSYTGCTESQFTLQFRIYSMEAIGPSNMMSGYKRVLAALCLYAPPLHTFDADQILSLNMVNFGRTAIALTNAVNGTIDYATMKLGLKENAEETAESKKLKDAALNGWQNLSDFGSAAVSAMRADTGAEQSAQVKRMSNAIKDGLTNLQKFLTDERFSQTDLERVNNPLNYYNGIYGGALWHLSILPGVFSHKLPVYVQSWTAKPSKEIDSTGKAAFMDFTVTCVLDQIKTGNWWANEIYAPEADAYKNTYRRLVKTPN